MIILGVVGVFLAIVAIIYWTTKNLNVMVAAPLASLIVALTNQMPILETMLGKEQSYMTGLAGFLINNFAIFMLGSILAKYMEASGATQTIANSILRVVGKESPYKVLLAIVLIASLLTYGGVSLFVVIFTLLPLSRPLFKELNINWELFPIPVFLGVSTLTMSSLPGTPSIHNAVPTKVLGTTLTAAPLLSLVSSLILVVFGLTYMWFALKKSMARNEGYTERDEEIVSTDNANLPNLVLASLPMLSLVATIFIFQKTPYILVVGLTVAILVSDLLFRKNLVNQQTVLNEGTTASVLPAFATSSTVAFGTVLAMSSGFLLIQDWIGQISGSPLISLSVSTALIGGIIGSSSGAVGIAASNFLPTYLDSGIDPQVLHRVTVIASAVLTVVPQSGVMITFHNLAKLSMKRGLKHSFIVVNIGHLLALIAVLILAQLLY